MTYEKHATRQNPGKDDYIIVEVRSPSERRVVNKEHHSYIKFLKDGGMANVVDFKPLSVLEPMTIDKARSIAAEKHLHEYLAILVRWEAFGETTKSSALAKWKEAVEAEALALAGPELAEIA